MSQVCRHDGVVLTQAKNGKWVHVDELPKGVDSDHTPEPVDSEAYAKTVEKRYGLASAAEDMLHHHNQLHPASGCEWAERLSLALRAG